MENDNFLSVKIDRVYADKKHVRLAITKQNTDIIRRGNFSLTFGDVSIRSCNCPEIQLCGEHITLFVWGSSMNDDDKKMKLPRNMAGIVLNAVSELNSRIATAYNR